MSIACVLDGARAICICIYGIHTGPCTAAVYIYMHIPWIYILQMSIYVSKQQCCEFSQANVVWLVMVVVVVVVNTDRY